MRKSNIQKHWLQNQWQLSALAVAIQLGFSAGAWGAGKLPQGATVVNGQVVITKPSDTSMQINASGGSIVNWQQFSIGAGNQVRIALPSSSSSILNRVTGLDSSQLLGSLQSNGRVFLINPNGIVVGSGARIDTNSFIGSTLNMSDADFLAGKLRFLATTGAGSILNDGVITAGPGGRILLIAPDIQNTGIIHAPDGKILLAAGRSLEISSLDFEGVTFEIQAPTDSVLNLGQLLAENGAVSAFAGSLRNSGEIRATRMVQDADGSIILSGSNEIALGRGSQTVADGLRGGSIRVEGGGTTRVAGTVSATGGAGNGGSIQILGNRVALEAGARVDASGASGGGTVLVGGDFQGKNPDIRNASRVYVDADANIRADAIQSGDGGKVVVWADENTRYLGSLSAHGGAKGGNGGNAEVSGKQNLQFSGSADLSAAAGKSGNLLLDPLDILVSGTGGLLSTVVDQFSDFTGNVVTISPKAMNDVKGNVTLQANRDIYINDAVSLGTAGAGLTATAGGTTFDAAGGGQIYMNQGISTNGGAVTLRAVGISGTGAIATGGGAVDIKTSGSETYSGAITTTGGAVKLEAGAGSVYGANVNAGSGAVNLTTTTGSISSSTLTGGTVTLAATGGSVSSVNVNAATRVDASSSNNSIYLLNYASQPLRVGTLASTSTVQLRSDSGLEQAAGGSVTGTTVYIYNDSATATAGTVAAPLQIASPRLYVSGYSNTMGAAAHINFSGSPTLAALTLNGNLAALSSTTVTGAANLTSFALSNASGALGVSADSGTTSGFGSGFQITVSDAAINASGLNLLGGNVTLNSGAGLTVGTLNAASLYATAKGAVSLGTLTTTGSSGMYVSTNACTTSYVGCTAVSPITAATLNAGGTGAVTLRTYDNGDINITGGLTAKSASLTAGNQYYTVSSYPYFSMRTANNITVASATTSGSFSIDNNGIGDVTLSSLAAAGAVNVNAGTTYLVSDPTIYYGRTVTTTNNIAVTVAEPTTTTGNFTVSNSGIGNVTVTGAVTRHSGIRLTTSNGNVTALSDLSDDSSVYVSAGTNGTTTLGNVTSGYSTVSLTAGAALTAGNITSTTSSVTATAGTTMTVGQVNAGSLTGAGNNTTSLSAGGDLSFLNINSKALPAYGQSSGYGSVSLTSTSGSIKTRQDNTAADITANGNVTITANGATNGVIGESTFTNPLDVVSGVGTGNTVTLSAGKDIGTSSHAVNVDNQGVLSVTSTGGKFFVAAKDLASATQRSLSGIKLSASAAGLGNGGTSTLSSLDLSVNAASDGSTITIGDVVQSAHALNDFRFTTTGGGLNFGNINLTTTGYNQAQLTSAGALTQQNPVTTNNINAGYVYLNAGSNALLVGNVTSSATAVGNMIDITGGSVTTGDLTGSSVKVAGAAVTLGNVTSSGTSKYPSYAFVPRLGTSQYLTDEVRITASGALATGNISSATSASLTGAGVTVGGGTGTVTGGHNDNYYNADTIALQAGTGAVAVGNVDGYDVTMGGASITTGTVNANRTMTLGTATTATLNTGVLTATGPITYYGSGNVNLNAGNITTGNITTTSALNITKNALATVQYAPTGITMTAGSANLVSPTGINLSAATLNAPTVSLSASAGNITAPLTGTTSLTINTGGAFTASSTAALSTVDVTANGQLVGGGAGSTVTELVGTTPHQLMQVVDASNALTLTLQPSSGGTALRYRESNAAITDISASTVGTLASGSSIYISSPAAHVVTPSVTMAGGSLQIVTGGGVDLTSVSTGNGYVSVNSSAGAVNLTSVTTAGGYVDAYAATGAVTLTSVASGGGQISARTSGANTDINVVSVNSTGNNVTLTSDNGSIVASGAGLHIDSRNGINAGGTTTLSAAKGSVGSAGAQLKTSGAVSLTVAAKDAINVDVANTALTNLTVTTQASGAGAIAISNSNYAGFAVTRVGGTDLDLSAVTPTATGAFSLTARDGNINVKGDITNVTSLRLDAGYSQSSGNLNIVAPSGGARTVNASGTMDLKAGNDVQVAGGATATDSVQVQSGATMNVYAGHDIKVAGNGGSALLKLNSVNYNQTLSAGHDIRVTGGATGQAASSAQAIALGSQTLTATNDLLIQGGAGAVATSGGFARVQAGSNQTVNVNNLSVLGGADGAYAALQGVYQDAQRVHGAAIISGGTGSGAYAEMVTTTSTQYLGYQSGSYENYTDSVLVQGGSGAGAYASVKSGATQTVGTLGTIQVLAGSGAGANAELLAASSQTVGAVSNYDSYYTNYRPTVGVLVQGGANGTARIKAAGSQSVLAGTGGISVQGGSGAGMTASIETTAGSQTVGASSTSSAVPTASITVQGGAGGAAWIKANGSQTLMTGGNLDVLGGSGANTTASIESTAGSQSIGNTYTYFNDALDTIHVTGGTGSGAAAWIKAATGQTLDAGLDIRVTGGAAGAYADVVTAAGNQTIGNQNTYYYDQTDTIALTGGAGSGAYARMANLGGSQTLQASLGITLQGGAADGAGALALAANGQSVNTAGALSIVGGVGNAASPNESGLRNTTSGTQSVNATAGIALAGGGTGSTSWIKQAGSGAQTITSGADLLVTAPTAGADVVSIEAGAGGQTITASNTIALDNAGANVMQVTSAANQTFNAKAMSILMSSTTGTAPKTVVTASGNQLLSLSGNVAPVAPATTATGATLTLANFSATSGSQVLLQAGGTQTVAMNYLSAGMMQVGGTVKVGGTVGTATSLGATKVYSTGDQTLIVGELLVQGGATAAATSNLSAGTITSGTMLISTLAGPMRVLGGAAGSATIDPLNLNVVSNGSIQITGGTTSTAGSNVTAGVINMTATNGNMAVIGGGGGATVVASSTATANGINTFNLNNSGGLTFGGGGTVSATAGGTVLLGAPCTGCSSGLLGPFSVTAPAAVVTGTSMSYAPNLLVADTVALLDQATLELAAAGYDLIVAEDGTITTRRRSLVQCY